MVIQYCSDLHLEFVKNAYFLHSNRLVCKADILILAGDIFPFSKNSDTLAFFDWLSENYKDVYWLPGNHEYYYSDVIRFHKFKKKKIRANIHIVTNQVIVINDVNLIFSTLWGEISSKNEFFIKSSVNDFFCIKYDGNDFEPNHFNQLYLNAIHFLETELNKRQKEKNVIVTHHVPTLINYPEKYKNDPLNESFVVEMLSLIEKYQPEAWIYGHSHINTPDFAIGKTKMLTNQLGYVDQREHLTFKLDAFIEV